MHPKTCSNPPDWRSTSRVAPLAIVALITAGSFGQQQTQLGHIGIPHDWSHHALVFSQPTTPSSAVAIQQNARYWQQYYWRKAVVAGNPLATEAVVSPIPIPVFPVPPAKPGPVHNDWQVSLGAGGTSGAGKYPAKFTFDVNAAPSCTNDFVAYTTSLAGTSAASIVAFNNLYSTQGSAGGLCNTNGPNVMWSYKTNTSSAGAVLTSPALSEDGTKIAYVESGSSSGTILHILKWKSGEGGIASPMAPDSTPSTWSACSSGSSCIFNLTFSGGTSITDTNSSPFVDYATDSIYVGDNTGHLHKFTNVFGTINPGTAPAESGTPFIALTNAHVLTSPVYDGNGNVFVAAGNSSCGSASNGCTLYKVVVGTSPSQSTAGCYNNNGTGCSVAAPGFTDAPIVDPSSAYVYAFVMNDGSSSCTSSNACTYVYQWPTSSITGSPTKAQVGTAASSGGSQTISQGDFDNAFYTGNTGKLYVCGNTYGPPTLYQIAITSGVMATTTTALPALTSGSPNCSPITEFYNSNTNSDWIFLGVTNSGLPTGCSSGGCIMSFVITQWTAATKFAIGQEILDSNRNIEVVTTAGTSGSSAPSWSATKGATITNDGGVHWINQGPLLINDATNYPAWIASHSYTSDTVILDSNGNIQMATTAGTSNSSAPTWNTTPGATTSDHTVTWTNVGLPANLAAAATGGTSAIVIDNVAPDTWQSNTSYPANSLIIDSHGNAEQSSGGTSGATQPTWNTAVNGTTSDNGITWTNKGASQAASAYFSWLSNGTCNGTSTVGCAVKVTQSTLQ